jgi:predicted signal transduction protein with EAL and GGDEF domain
MRGPDFVARYGDEEFVVVMPNTTLAGANVFGDRLRNRVVQELGTSVCCGITQAHGGDDARSIFARADSALYSAKAAGTNRLFVHTGSHIREHNPGSAANTAAANSPPAACDSDAMSDTATDGEAAADESALAAAGQ